jgi:DNA uptake protein ComE-like DNA-binding protein
VNGPAPPFRDESSGAPLAATSRVLGRLRALLSHLTPAERRVLAFLIGWGVLGVAAAKLPPASFSSQAPREVRFPPGDLRAELHARSARLAAHLAAARTPPPEPLDPNAASREDLDRLPGVGPRTALRWIEERTARGPFLALADLRRVKGLGPRRLQAMARHLRFPPRAEEGGAEAARLDLNRASEAELADLPRVGPVLARRLVERRRLMGRFGSFAQVDSVSGVGPAVLRILSERGRIE